MKNNILNILSGIIYAKQNGNFRAKAEKVLSDCSNQPKMTVGICDHCIHMGFDEEYVVDPICKKNIFPLEINIPNQKSSIKNCYHFQSTDARYLTKGDLDVRTLEIGDMVYEYDYGVCIKSMVWSEPVLDEKTNTISWETIRLNDDIIKYSHNLDNPHLSVNLYNKPAYNVNVILE